MLPRPPISTLFPYTTLFRSERRMLVALRRWNFADDLFENFGDADSFLGADEKNLIGVDAKQRSEEHTSELQSRLHLVCRLLLGKKNEMKETVMTCTQYSGGV